ncbi:MAG TPA: M28 family peptidase [Longimicrobiaceae bacterium]|jgi:N-acetylated-alpha-linked acidic dipeptidase
MDLPGARPRRRCAAGAPWRGARIAAALALLAAAPGPTGAQAGGAISGFTAEGAARQREREARFLAVPSRAGAERTVRSLSRGFHVAGTREGKAVADTLAAWMRGLGFQVSVERFDPWLPHPRRTRVTLLAPERRELATREPGGDSPLLQSWAAYGANGAAEGEVVYASFGREDDYRRLERAGVEVRGRVVLVRYGLGFRGAKVAEAERRGAVGVLLYSDPDGDGYVRGDTAPAGPSRPSWSVQRGTVEYLWLHPGDPLTPGRPALPGVPRLDPAEAGNLPRIPVVPLSYGEARRILAALGGPEAPHRSRGALPVAYRQGPGPARVRLESEQHFAQRPVYNVVARIPGRTDEEVILGNHHDAWLLGGADPHSGTSALVEAARGLAELRRAGWTPRRGITLAFWDAEEFGATGSTEWVEAHAERLARTAVAYFNVDMFTAGTLDVSGSPSLRDLVLEAAEAVPDPVTRRPLAEGWRARQPLAPTPVLGALGAGSDWTAFFHWAGVPSLQWTARGRGFYGVYHSVLDDFAYAGRWADAGFLHAPAVAGVMGVAALRLADADALPFRYTHYAERLEGYFSLVPGVGRGAWSAPVREAAAEWRAAAAALEAAQARALAAGDTAMLARADRALPAAERALLDARGMPGRPWYRHTVYAPGRYSGYDAVPLAELMEAYQDGDAAARARGVERLAAALRRSAAVLRGVLPPASAADARFVQGPAGSPHP